MIPAVAAPESPPDQPGVPVGAQNPADHQYRQSTHIRNTRWPYMPAQLPYRVLENPGEAILIPLEF